MNFSPNMRNPFEAEASSPGRGLLHQSQPQNQGNTSSLAQLPTIERIDPCSVLNTFGHKKKKHLLPAGFEPDDYTVVLGRAREFQEYAGNKRLKAIVDAHLHLYNEAPDKLEKTVIVTKVFNQVRAATSTGHFVKLEKGRYYEVGERTARERIGAMFRDSLSAKYKSSAKNKLAARMVKKASRTSQDCSMKEAARTVQQQLENHANNAVGSEEEEEPDFYDFSDVFD